MNVSDEDLGAAWVRQRQLTFRRQVQVASLAQVVFYEVVPVKTNEVRGVYKDRGNRAVVDVMLQEPASYWRVGERYYFDDPHFGPPVEVDDLDYDAELGLHVRKRSRELYYWQG